MFALNAPVLQEVRGVFQQPAVVHGEIGPQGPVTQAVFTVAQSSASEAKGGVPGGPCARVRSIAAQSMERSAVLLQTRNGGASWTALPSSVFPGFPQRMEAHGLPYLFDKSGVTFRSRKVGWVLGGNEAPKYVLFERTTNGGRTLAPQALPPIDGYGIGATDPPVFPTLQTGWLPVNV